MSKSKLTGISPSDITDFFGVDAFRYYFLRAIPFGTDGSFSWEDMVARYTSELANDFGNLASRAIAMVEKYCDGKIPNIAHDEVLARSAASATKVADERITALDFQSGILAILDFCKAVNGYVTEKAPWVLAKDPAKKGELDHVLYATCESLRILAVLLLFPFHTLRVFNNEDFYVKAASLSVFGFSFLSGSPKNFLTAASLSVLGSSFFSGPPKKSLNFLSAVTLPPADKRLRFSQKPAGRLGRCSSIMTSALV